MKAPKGVLSWTDAEHAEHARIGKWPERTVDDPKPPSRRPVGALGMTAEELATVRRTKKWPKRALEVQDGPPGLTLTSLPSMEYLRGFAAGYKAARGPRGPRHQIAGDITLILKLLEERDGNVEQAREAFIVEVGRTRLIDEPPRPRLTVRSTSKDLTFHQTDKRVIDLTPEKRSVISKRFTRAMKRICPSG
jgi:hypothetical protein